MKLLPKVGDFYRRMRNHAFEHKKVVRVDPPGLRMASVYFESEPDSPYTIEHVEDCGYELVPREDTVFGRLERRAS